MPTEGFIPCIDLTEMPPHLFFYLLFVPSIRFMNEGYFLRRECLFMTHTTLSSDSSRTRRLALAGVFTALAIVGSFLSFPVAGSKCAPVQHIINILAAVMLGPWYSVGIAFCASLLRNLLGLGSMMAFPGSMVGALCCGLVYSICHKLSLTCLAEALGTGILGGLAAYPVAVYIMGITPAGIFVYVVPFLISTIAGSILAFLLITTLNKSGIMSMIKTTR